MSVVIDETVGKAGSLLSSRVQMGRKHDSYVARMLRVAIGGFETDGEESGRCDPLTGHSCLAPFHLYPYGRA